MIKHVKVSIMNLNSRYNSINRSLVAFCLAGMEDSFDGEQVTKPCIKCLCAFSVCYLCVIDQSIIRITQMNEVMLVDQLETMDIDVPVPSIKFNHMIHITAYHLILLIAI